MKPKAKAPEQAVKKQQDSIAGLKTELPPIFLPKGQKFLGPKKISNPQTMKQTQKSFSTIRKIKDHKKLYVSPYSIHAVKKP